MYKLACCVDRDAWEDVCDIDKIIFCMCLSSDVLPIVC